MPNLNEVKIYYPNNPRGFSWREIIDSVYFNLGDNTTSKIVHFSIDVKVAIEHSGRRLPDYSLGAIEDHALFAEISSTYPEEEREYLDEHVFFRVLSVDLSNTDQVEEWVFNTFGDHPSHIWIDGVMVGGVCFPQEYDHEDEFSPFPEKLSKLTTYAPNGKVDSGS